MSAPRPTRYKELGYKQLDRGLWRILTTEDGAAVGPLYRSRAELLADLDRYADAYGCGSPPFGETVPPAPVALSQTDGGVTFKQDVATMPVEDLRRFVRDLQEMLYFDGDDTGWNPDKELDAEFIGYVCNLFTGAGLAPEVKP